MNSSSVEKFSTSSNHALEIATAISANKPIDREITALVLKLQTALNINQVIEIFYSSLKTKLSMCGIEYEYPLLYSHIQEGNKTSYCYSYLIEIENETWGNITIYSEKELPENSKNRLDEFISAVIYPLRNAIQHENAISLSANDSYLGLPNWGLLEGQLTREAKLAIRRKHPLSLVLIDIDRYKTLKERYGSLFGDIIIRHVYETFQSSLRDTDIIYRFNYDQFSLILSETSATAASQIAERIRKVIMENALKDENNKNIRFTISIGITELQSDDSVDSLYKRAHNALKLAKKSGRNQVKVADGKFLV